MTLVKQTARLVFGLFVLAFLLAPDDSRGCAPAWRDGGPPVSIASEEALIVWDQDAETEYFVRRSTFRTTEKFAFLVPTPTLPTYFEVEDQVFEQLKEWTKPRIIRREIRRR